MHTYEWAIEAGIISKQMRKSWIATEICSVPSKDLDVSPLCVSAVLRKINLPPSCMKPAETSSAIMTLCQKEKKMIALTHRNFGKGLPYHQINRSMMTRDVLQLELQNPPKICQIFLCSVKEYHQTPETQADAQIVKESEIEIGALPADLSVLIIAGSLEDHGQYGQNRFDVNELQNPSLHKQECVWVANVYLTRPQRARKEILRGWSGVEHDDQCALSTKLIQQQVEECINHKCLVDVPERIDVKRNVQ